MKGCSLSVKTIPLAAGALAELWLRPLRLEVPQEENHQPERYF